MFIKSVHKVKKFGHFIFKFILEILMLFRSNKSSAHKPEQISRNYHRLMLQLKTWETNHYTPDLNEE
ncbi:TPA: hypothetical protein JBI45_09765, partial [Legionella pneumophila]|nr:hypothetical protein [Legionella pneumophila]